MPIRLVEIMQELRRHFGDPPSPILLFTYRAVVILSNPLIKSCKTSVVDIYRRAFEFGLFQVVWNSVGKYYTRISQVQIVHGTSQSNRLDTGDGITQTLMPITYGESTGISSIISPLEEGRMGGKGEASIDRLNYLLEIDTLKSFICILD